jgi:hypothetical protein
VIEDAQFVNPSAIAARLQHQSSSPLLRRLSSLICPLPKILPGETIAYVRLVTGYSAEQWAGRTPGIGEMQSERPVPCREIDGFLASTTPRDSKPPPPPLWGVELVGGSTDENALAAYRRLEQKYASILGGRQAFVVHHGLGRGSMSWAHVRVGADDRPNAEKLCANCVAA